MINHSRFWFIIGHAPIWDVVKSPSNASLIAWFTIEFTVTGNQTWLSGRSSEDFLATFDTGLQQGGL